MKKTLLILVLAFLAVAGVAQVEYTYDFNGLNEGQQNLNGQDGWVTHYQTAGTSQDFDVAYSCDGLLSPDESIAVFYPYGGPGVGRTATHKADNNFNFNFTNGGIIDLEFDVCHNWWGVFVGVGYDADGDGNILDGMVDEDGGVKLLIKGSENDNYPSLHFPVADEIVSTSFQQQKN